MAKTDDIVTLSEGKGKNKIVYHYTEESIKKIVKEELIAAVEAGEKSPFMRLLHLRKGNLNSVKKDCTSSILDKVDDYKKRVNTDENVSVEYIAGGYVNTITGIVNEAVDSLMANVNFAKKMIKENPIQVIELGLFKEFVNTDNKIFILLFNSLLESKDANAGKLADRLFNKFIIKDEEKIMMIAKNPKAEKYIEEVLKGDQIKSKAQYAKFAKAAAKYNPAVLNSIDVKKLAPADILAIIKSTVDRAPEALKLLTYLDAKTAKKYLKIIIKYSNKALQAKLEEIKAIENEDERKQKLATFKEEVKDYLNDFRSSAQVVAGYVVNCEIYEVWKKTEALHKESSARHEERTAKINKEFDKAKGTADKILQKHKKEKSQEAADSITDEDYEYMFMEVIRDMGIKKFEKDESETFKAVLKEKLEEVDEKFPKDTYPDNNKKLKRQAVKDTFKDLLSGKVRTKITQKLHNASIPRREKVAKKLTDERIGVLVDERYAELIKEFEIKYNDAIENLLKRKELKIEESFKLLNKEYEKDEKAKRKKEEKINKESNDLLNTIESEDSLGL